MKLLRKHPLALIVLSLALSVMVVSCWKYLTYTFYWDTGHSLMVHANRISDSYLLITRQPLDYKLYFNLLANLVNAESDYPHTFLVPLVYSLTLFLFPSHAIFVSHIVSLCLSLLFLATIFYVLNRLFTVRQATIVTLLISTNSLFLAQTLLIYHEIPATLFKYVAVYFLIQEKPKLFLIASLFAFLVRFENGVILGITAFIWFILANKDTSGLTNFASNILRYVAPLFLITFIWLLIHFWISGWLVLHPDFGHPVDRLGTLTKLIHFLLIGQNRVYLSVIALTNLILLPHVISKHKKKVTILFISLLLSTSVFYVLGNAVERYILSLLPFFFLIVSFSTEFFESKVAKNLVAILLIIFGSLLQVSTWYSCQANFETCLTFNKWMELKKEIASYSINTLDPGVVIYADWDIAREFSDPQLFRNWYSQKVILSKPFPEDEDAFMPGNYILVTQNTNVQNLQKVAGIPKQFEKEFINGNVTAQLFKIEDQSPTLLK